MVMFTSVIVCMIPYITLQVVEPDLFIKSNFILVEHLLYGYFLYDVLG